MDQIDHDTLSTVRSLLARGHSPEHISYMTGANLQSVQAIAKINTNVDQKYSPAHTRDADTE